jgi:hypothetical protein
MLRNAILEELKLSTGEGNPSHKNKRTTSCTPSLGARNGGPGKHFYANMLDHAMRSILEELKLVLVLALVRKVV